MNRRYYWLKLKQDFFTSLPMKKLRRIAGGDTYTIIYLKMQLLSIKDEGVLYFQGYESDFCEEMALALGEEVDNVRATILFLESVGLLKKQGDTEYLLTEVPFCIGSESESAERVRKHRQNKLTGQQENSQKALQCNADVTKCNTEIEKEKEKEIEIEIEQEGKKISYQKIADMYNETCVSLPRVTSLSDARRKAIRARLKTYSIDDLKRVFEKAEASNFLKGANARNWNATFDWLLKDCNMAKVLDGNYDNTRAPAAGAQAAGNRIARQLDASYNMIAGWAESEG
jgi:predicted phage replisome organizer